jgi:hypothetical protein
MIEKEFAPYEEAFALKELGFDELCFAYYKDMKGKKVLLYDSMDFDGECNTPLYQQAFRWFREKYGLGHMINGIGHESFIMNIGGMLHIFNGFEFKTYEEAELACLKKLIELANEQQIRKIP